jgi:purine/pyrimidine-nucleoside phosphorylase
MDWHSRRFLSCRSGHKTKSFQRKKERIMSEFNHISIIKKANVYFDGNVTSRTLIFPDGSRKTLGIMLPGDYHFNTADKELMEILSGDLEVLLPGADGWKPVKGGDAFEVPAQSGFDLKVKSITDYCCSFIK